jgi:transcriptional antiterminator RfaH
MTNQQADRRDQTADAARWYLIQTRPRQGDRAQQNLERQGYEVYHPRRRSQRIRNGRRLTVDESLFPNYLFIRLRRWIDNWAPLRSTRGVARLVTFGNEPLPVDDRLIEEIRRRISQNAVEPALISGQQVQITSGPFLGLDAIFQAHKDEQRVLLLIELLHRQVTVSVPLADIRRSA